MVALLATAAFLQYRWTNEASAASEMRIGAELESLMMKWHADLYGEFSAICSAMQVGPDSGARDTWNDYLERYVEWSSTLPHESLPNVYRNPELVEDVYIWDTNLGASPQLFRLSAEKQKIEAAETPQKLKILLNRLRANSSSLLTSFRVWQLPGRVWQSSPTFDRISPPNAPENSMGWQFDESIPAIVHPIFQRDGRSLNRQSPVDWMVIVLDANALQERILPGLALRYFGGLEGLEYRVAVIAKGATPRIIYSSDPGFGSAQVDTADASLSIFGPSLEKPQDLSGELARNHSLQSTEWHSFYGPVWFPVIRYEDGPNPWILVVQHRSNPLQDVIVRVRQKNLAMSALLLLLLGLNMTLLAIAGLRAQKFTRMQMDFVASVSHELRTPLTAIFAAAENIKDGVIHEKSNLEDYGSMLMSQSRQLMDHVDRILVFASMRSGKDRYNLRPLHVCEVLERVRKNLAILIIEHGFLIEEFVEPDLPCVIGDLAAICGCLENLITNAIKYGGTDRRIRIRAQRESKENGEMEIAISIEDHGIGIHRSDFKRIFEPFYRAADVTRAQIPGTGLGLSVSKHLAEAMDGRLSVESEFGVGSVFTLHLPVTTLEASESRIANSRREEVTEHE
jgi:signal transduction histidine kinase